MTHDPVSAGQDGRSNLRRLNLHHNGRKRPFARRIGAVAFVCAVLGYVAASTVLQLHATNGPFAVFYWLHDHVWLPFKGHFWTAIFPYSLLWFVPLVVALLALAIEFLTPFGLIGMQWSLSVIYLRIMGSRSRPVPLVDIPALEAAIKEGVWDGVQTSQGLLQRVAREQWWSQWQRAREARIAGRTLDQGTIKGLQNAALVWYRLTRSNPRAILACLETAAVAPGEDCRAFATRLAPMFKGVGPDAAPDIIGLKIAAETLARALTRHDALAVVDHLHEKFTAHPKVPLLRVSLACNIVIIGWAARQYPMASARACMEAIDLLRYQSALSPVASSKTGANPPEAWDALFLVDVELWSLEAERAAQSRPKGALLKNFGLTPDTAEVFATGGIAS